MDLYCIGEMLIDFTPGSEPASYIRNAGGAPANVAIAAAKNGLEAGMNCSLGDDDFGHFLMDTLKEYHVRCLNPEFCQEAITTMAFVTLTPEGDRSFTFARKPGADSFLSESRVREEDIAGSVIIHSGSCSLSVSPEDAATEKALRLGHEMGKLVSFDVNYRDMMWGGKVQACRDRVLKCLPWVDLLKISDEEAGMFGGESAIPGLMERYHLSLVVETLGADGARAWYGGKILSVPGRKAHCVDTTGAGDAFWGGLLSSLRLQGVEKAEDLTEEAVLRAMNYGNVAGWLCVQSKGAIPSLPSREQIEQHL